MEFKHKPVLLDETINGLNIKPNGIYVDGTLGGAGHSNHILKRLSSKGLLIGIDRDTLCVPVKMRTRPMGRGILYGASAAGSGASGTVRLSAARLFMSRTLRLACRHGNGEPGGAHRVLACPATFERKQPPCENLPSVLSYCSAGSGMPCFSFPQAPAGLQGLR